MIFLLELILARHGQTQWNKEARFQGWSDSPLTKLGVSQAKKIAKFLDGKKIDAIFCSDLGRAKETAAFIIQHHPESNVEFVEELRELSFGLLEGKTWNDAADDVPNLFELETKDRLFIPHPRGESFEDLRKRVGKFLKKILKLHDKRILLVSHDGVGRSILQNLFDLDFEQRGNVCHPHEIIYVIKISESGEKACEWFNVVTGEAGGGFYIQEQC
ncbi:MAG: histidine phosphatase family protein [Candidatus Diapherotrites archaeon]|nr:histidine phosphatase family protein [Candidatus Diapherotrites archaeon]